jgi:DNA-binding IscR family transcriptional regulator
LLEVVEAIDGPIFLNECVSDTGACNFSEECPMHPIWQDAQEHLIGQLRKTTFAAAIKAKAASKK